MALKVIRKHNDLVSKEISQMDCYKFRFEDIYRVSISGKNSPCHIDRKKQAVRSERDNCPSEKGMENEEKLIS